VLKKMSVAGGMLIATTAGAMMTSLPAFAGVPAWGGGGGCCSSSHSSFFHHARNRNWNGTENDNLNHIRLRIHNRNNNVAVARNDEEPDQRPLIIKEREHGHHHRGYYDPSLTAPPAVGAPPVVGAPA
jgi:hypothetical protein